MSDGESVLVANVSPKVSESELKELFECCGPVLRVQLDSSGGKCTITYGELAHARAAVLLTDTPLGDQPIVVTVIDAAAKRAEEIARTIQAANVPRTVSEEQLKKFFSSCGSILIVKIADEGTDAHSPRSGYVEFARPEDAQAALNMNNPNLAGSVLKISQATTPISKIVSSSVAKKDLSEVLAKVLAATKGRRSRERSRDRFSRDRSSRDRSSHRSSRDRSSHRSRHSRSRSRRRSRSSSRSRSPSPVQCFNCGETGHISRQCPNPSSRSRSPGTIKKKMRMPDRSGMIFNGYKWESIQNHSGITQTTGGRQPVQAVQLLQQALLVKQAKKSRSPD